MPLLARHFVELGGVGVVLAGYLEVFLGHEQVEIVVDGRHGHRLGSRQKRRLGLGVAHRLYAAVPLDSVDAEYRLRQRQRHRDGHEPVVGITLQFAEPVERGVDRQLRAGEPHVLRDRQAAVHLQEVVAHERVGAVGVHIRRILLVVGGHGGRQVHLREQFGPVGAVLPVGRAQLVERHGRIDAVGACAGYGVVERQPDGVGGGALGGHGHCRGRTGCQKGDSQC